MENNKSIKELDLERTMIFEDLAELEREIDELRSEVSEYDDDAELPYEEILNGQNVSYRLNELIIKRRDLGKKLAELNKEIALSDTLDEEVLTKEDLDSINEMFGKSNKI